MIDSKGKELEVGQLVKFADLVDYGTTRGRINTIFNAGDNSYLEVYHNGAGTQMTQARTIKVRLRIMVAGQDW